MKKHDEWRQLPIIVDSDSSEPLYVQIKNQLRALIMSGKLSKDTLLPSIRALSQQLSCSIITTRRAYHDLEIEGIIKTKQGLGTFVTEIQQQEQSFYQENEIRKILRDAITLSKSFQYSSKDLIRMLTEELEKEDKS
ncbi:GntR family transcriptional regulator [Bacillus chungangensis]|uniref:GntR family transcriptional regulator n=1 Tax=Bacillus chungangensis TaxID=587633 RepID=A0ABT9WTL8_9BACI|nr:GntR family transcriptional regulator [Bacillus chungangensis]MDQ0176651.1 GntR family transcriptional regulator [Bacillus chungangensis]